ncbi:MAG TPA: hypothetical protein VG713_12375 [Pirellulales bacterium]|nr:hypothetical protein [Pirellulales bacterium]
MRSNLFPMVAIGCWPVLTIAGVLQIGCNGRSRPSSDAAHERSFDEQIAAVRNGAGDRIELESQGLGDADLDRLAGLDNLRVVLLDNAANSLSDAGLEKLARLPKLQHLRVRGGDFGDRGLAALAGCRELQILNLPVTHATDAGLAQLSRLPKLVQLRIGSPTITTAGLQSLEQFPELRRLHLIDVPVSDAGLAVLQQLPQLESLYLDGARASDSAYAALFRARPTLHVHINQSHHDHDPQHQTHAH